jgi:hypothetical protein
VTGPEVLGDLPGEVGADARDLERRLPAAASRINAMRLLGVERRIGDADGGRRDGRADQVMRVEVEERVSLPHETSCGIPGMAIDGDARLVPHGRAQVPLTNRGFAAEARV